MSTLPPTDPPAEGELAAALLRMGDRLLEAAAAGDVEQALACTQERGTLVAQLAERLAGEAGPKPTAAQAARLAEQHRAATEALAAIESELGAAIGRADRYHHAATRYGAAPASAGHLHARV